MRELAEKLCALAPKEMWSNYWQTPRGAVVLSVIVPKWWRVEIELGKSECPLLYDWCLDDLAQRGLCPSLEHDACGWTCTWGPSWSAGQTKTVAVLRAWIASKEQ